MKRSTVAAAALLSVLAGAAQAQSSVTLYGRLNLSIESQEFVASNDRVTNFVDNGSRIGFKGVEDLGGGMKAGFQIEHGFDVQNGTADSTFWGRQSEVFLGHSDWGTLRLGSFTSEAYFATADYVSLHNHDTGTSSDALYADTRGFGQSNKVGYMSPSWGGAVLHLAASEADATGDRTYELAVNYDAGPLHLGLGAQQTGDKDQIAIRGLYEFGDFILGGYIQHDNDVYLLGSRTTFRVSGQYNLGASEFHANIGWASDYSSLDQSSANQWTLAYNYNLSKRTKVYAFYSKLGADDDLRVYGGTRNTIAAGIRHNF